MLPLEPDHSQPQRLVKRIRAVDGHRLQPQLLAHPAHALAAVAIAAAAWQWRGPWLAPLGVALGVIGLTLQVIAQSVRHAIGIWDPTAVPAPPPAAAGWRGGQRNTWEAAQPKKRSMAFMRPMFPSLIRSLRGSP